MNIHSQIIVLDMFIIKNLSCMYSISFKYIKYYVLLNTTYFFKRIKEIYSFTTNSQDVPTET